MHVSTEGCHATDEDDENQSRITGRPRTEVQACGLPEIRDEEGEHTEGRRGGATGLDRATEERAQRIDEAHANLKADLAKEKQEFKDLAEKLEGMSSSFREESLKDKEGASKPLTASDYMAASMNAWALAQVYRLGERLSTELEFVYESTYQVMKNVIDVRNLLPDEIRADMETTLERYAKRIQGGLMTDQDKIVVKLLYEKLSDLGYDEE